MALSLPSLPRNLRRPTPSQGAAVLDSALSWLSAAWVVSGSDDKHSRRVALLKRLLPATGLFLLLLITLWPRLAPLWDRMRLTMPAIDLRDARELRMLNPRYAGLDHQGRPYIVTAAVGHQVPDRQDLMSLEQPRADMKTHTGADVVLTAATGVYQSQAQLLDLFGDVNMTHQNGTRFVTDTARINVQNSSAEGSDAVEGHGPSGDVKAAGFKILDKGDTIIFTGKSDLLLRGSHTNTAKAAAPAGLPAPVAAVASEMAAQAKPALAGARPEHAAKSTEHKAGHKAAEHRTTEHRTTKHRAAEHRTIEHRTIEHGAAEHDTAKPASHARSAAARKG